MKTNLDQISIPPLCRGMSEMAHTLVGKAVPLQLQGHGFNPQLGQCAAPQVGSGAKWNFFVFFYVFFCALMVFLLLHIPENAGVM